MKKVCSLTSQSKNWFIVYRKNIKRDINVFINWCNTYCDRFAIIEHENDISPIGLLEGCHYHIVAITTKKHQKAFILNAMRDLFGDSDSNGIQADIITSEEGALQYLTHQNDKSKTQHDVSEIKHNYPLDLFNQLMTTQLSDTGSITGEYIIAKVNECEGDDLKLMTLVSPSTLNRYWWLFDLAFVRTYAHHLGR